MIPSEGQKKHYNTKRETTLNAIREAVHDMQQAGIPVTRKALIEFTGKSDATFSLPHVKALLQELHVCQFAPKKTVSEQDVMKNDFVHVVRERDALRKKVDSLNSTVFVLEGKNKDLMQQNEKLTSETESLRGRLQQALELAHMQGHDISKLFTS